MIKVYSRDGHTAVFACSRCGERVTIAIPAVDQGLTELEQICTCGQVHTVKVDRRRTPRKTVELFGTYFLDPSKDGRPMRVRSLSSQGLGFEPLAHSHCEVGDELVVEIKLNNPPLSVRKEAIVRTLRGALIGVEFLTSEFDSTYERFIDIALAIYVLEIEEKQPSC